MSEESPLKYLVKYPRVQAKNSPPLLVMLHGYGSHEEDLFSFADQLTDRFLVVSVRAPINLPWGGFAWYNINFTESAERFGDPSEALAAVEKISTFVKYATHKYATDANQTAIMGFSQGAILSYATAFRNPGLFKTVLALSGYIFKEIMPLKPSIDELKKISFFGTHGIYDPVIPVEWARASKAYLENYDINLTMKEYVMEHGINPDCFRDLMQWIAGYYPKL